MVPFKVKIEQLGCFEFSALIKLESTQDHTEEWYQHKNLKGQV